MKFFDAIQSLPEFITAHLSLNLDLFLWVDFELLSQAAKRFLLRFHYSKNFKTVELN